MAEVTVIWLMGLPFRLQQKHVMFCLWKQLEKLVKLL